MLAESFKGPFGISQPAPQPCQTWIWDVERWRNRLTDGDFSTFVSGGVVTPAELRNDRIRGVYDSVGLFMLLNRVIGALKANTANGETPSLSAQSLRHNHAYRNK